MITKVKKSKKWEVLKKLQNSKIPKIQPKKVIKVLLENRGLKTEKEKTEFVNPIDPEKLSLRELGISEKSLDKAIVRIDTAIKNNEKILIYGDYDADGICATAILWETLYKYTSLVLPHIPDRFSEGYGINPQSIKNLKEKNKNLD